MPAHRSPASPAGRRRRLGGALVALAAALAAGAPPAGAVTVGPTDLYVSASAGGNPTCDTASQANPFATVAGALHCAAATGTTIHIGPGSFAGGFIVSKSVSLVGAGRATVITGSTNVLDLSPAIRIRDGHQVTVKGLTIDGVDENAQGIEAGRGSLTVTNATIEHTGAHGRAGAGIDVTPASGTATVKITGSTLTGNAGDQGGGGIHVTSTGGVKPSTLSVVDSTLTGNDGSSGGGGAILLGQASLVAREDTIAGNTANFHGGGISKDLSPGTVSLQNTILAANTGGATDADCDVPAAKAIDGGHDLVGTGCPGFADTVHGDRVGTPGAPLDPALGALADNGGPTDTMAPHLGSEALNAGDAAACLGTTDQRGHSRHAADRLTCDIGAVDAGATPKQTLYVSPKSAGDPTCATASSSHRFKTVAAALACANNGTTLKLLAGTYAGELTVAHNVTVVGAGASTVIAGSTDFLDLTPDVTVAPRAEVTLEDLTVDGINQTAPGVVAHSGRVTMIGATITRSGSIGQSTPLAGGLSIVPGAGSAAEATVYDSTIDHDLAQFSGGGILVDPVTGGTSPASALAILNSTIADNTAQGSGGGGGLWISQAGATLRDSTITGNTAEGGGAAASGATARAAWTSSTRSWPPTPPRAVPIARR